MLGTSVVVASLEDNKKKINAQMFPKRSAFHCFSSYTNQF